MKLYGEFTKQDWLNILDVQEDKIPTSFIIHGEWNHEENLTLWKNKLKEEVRLRSSVNIMVKL